jgi:hypothetical protein
MAAPEVARTAADMAGKAIVMKVDTERYPALAARFNVRGIPNFVVFHAGQPVAQQAGVVNHQQLESWFEIRRDTISSLNRPGAVCCSSWNACFRYNHSRTSFLTKGRVRL